MTEKTNWIRRRLGFPLDEAYRVPIEQGLEKATYRVTRNAGILILVFQAFMMTVTALKEGGPFAFPRRSMYWWMYASLFTVTLLLLAVVCLRHKQKKLHYRRFLRLQAVYASLLCLWSTGITLVDQIGDGGLTVFSYICLSTAAFAILKPWQSIAIFGGNSILLNGLLPIAQDGTHQVFNNLVNSSFIAVLSICISIIFYNSKVRNLYDKIIIERQVEEIRAYNEQLNWMAMTDELTHMYNRRYLEKISLDDRWFAWDSAAGFMLDIDYFKQYNDTYGHVEGDVCLKNIANEIISFIKTKNACAVRYGGEEFFICLFGCGPEEALRLAEELRLRIQRGGFTRTDVPQGCVTVSVGVCTAKNWRETSLDEIIRRSDLALYEAKSRGRNRVEAYEPVPV